MTLTTFIKSNYFGLIYCLSIYTFADHKRAKLLKVPAIFFNATKYVYCLFNQKSTADVKSLVRSNFSGVVLLSIMIALFMYCEWSIFAFDVQLEWEDPLQITSTSLMKRRAYYICSIIMNNDVSQVVGFQVWKWLNCLKEIKFVFSFRLQAWRGVHVGAGVPFGRSGNPISTRRGRLCPPH